MTPTAAAQPEAVLPLAAAAAPGESAAPLSTTTRAHRVALLLILLLALFLRLRGLDAESLWFDESATVRIVKQDLVRMFELIRFEERIPPLHYLVLHAWVRLFGDAEWSVRLPSALAGTAAVWAVYRLGANLFGGSVGCAAALLMAVSRMQVVYSQEARSYSLLALLSVLSCDLFVRLLREPTLRREVAYVAVSALLLYSHLYGVFTLAAQHLTYAVLLLTRRRPAAAIDANRWLVLNVAVGAIFAPWVPTAVRWTKSVGTGFWVRPMTFDDLADAYRWHLGSTAMVVAIVVFVVIGVARVRRHVLGLTLVLGLATIPVVVPVVLSILSKPTFTYRYAIAAPAGLFILAACGVTALRYRVAQIAAMGLLLSLSLTATLPDGQKPEWRTAIAYVTRAARPGDYVVLTPRLTTFLYDYYGTRTDVTRKGIDFGTIPLGLPRPPGEHTWLVFNPRDTHVNYPLLRGPWCVLSRAAFGELLVLELDDEEPASSTTAPVPSS